MDRRYRDYMAALEAERRKILVFQSELPLSLQLVTQTIVACRQQMEAEETTSDPSDDPIKEGERPSDWLRSVQSTDVVRKPVALNATRLGGAFHPFNKEKMVPALAPVRAVPASSSTAETTIITGGEREIEGQSQSQRKSRRCWSPELHRKFMNAIQQLGGSQAATPKQIREMMKVDRLTNDEVKSHLQKYRLHTRRPTSALHNRSILQPSQFVVVSDMWAPPADCSAATAQISGGAKYDTPRDGIYAPVASLPNKGFTLEKKNESIRSPSSPLDHEGRCGEDVDGIVEVNAASPTSSSSQTVTASPPS